MSKVSKISNLILATIYVGACCFSAHSADDKFLELQQKHDTTNGNNNRASQETFHKIKSKNYSKNSGKTLESDLINKHYIGTQTPSKSYDFSKYDSDFEGAHKKAVGQSKYISQGVKNPTFENDQVQTEYYENGATIIKKDDDGRYLINENPEKGQLSTKSMDSTEMVGNEANHSDTQSGGGAEFSLHDDAGSEIEVRKSVTGSLTYLQNSPEGSGMQQVDAYKSIVIANEENTMSIEQDDPLFNATYQTVAQTQEDAFNDCTETTRVIDVTETFPREEREMCAIISTAGPQFCEIYREVVNFEELEHFIITYSDSQDKVKRYTGNDGLGGKSHEGFGEGKHWDIKRDVYEPIFAGGGALFGNEKVIDPISGVITQNINIWMGVTDMRTEQKQIALGARSVGSIPVYDDSLLRGYGGQLLLSMTQNSTVIGGSLILGETGANTYPNYDTSDDKAEVLMWLEDDHVVNTTYVDLDKNIYFGNGYNAPWDSGESWGLTPEQAEHVSSPRTDFQRLIDNPDGSQTMEITFKLSNLFEICTTNWINGDVECDSTVPLELYTNVYEFNVVHVSLDNNNREVNIDEKIKSLLKNKHGTEVLNIKVFSNNEGQEFRTDHKHRTGLYRQAGAFGGWHDSIILTDYKESVTFKLLQPAFTLETREAYYPEGCGDNVNIAGSIQTLGFKTANTEEFNSECTFDGSYSNLEEGDRGYPQFIIDLMPPLYPGDTGQATWRTSLNNYQCDPFGGGTKIIDGVPYSWEDIVEQSQGCSELESDIQCEMDISVCDILDSDGTSCLLESREYVCDRTYSVTKPITLVNNTCDMDIPCAGGECEDEDGEYSTSFDEALVGISIATNMRGDRQCSNEADPDTCEVFKGEQRHCHYDATIGQGNDCCEVPGGTDVVGFISASWQMGKVTGLNDMTYEYAEAGWKSASEFVTNTDVYQSAADGLSTLTKPLTTAVESMAGNAANSAGETVVQEGAEDAFAEEIGQQAMKFVSENMPDDLASLLIKQSSDQAGKYVLTEGAKTAANMASAVMTAYSYYTYFKLALDLITACDEDEADMGVQIGHRQCILTSRERVNMIQKKQNHCCFNSPLARIIVEQSIPQLGYRDSDDYRDAGCPGLTPPQLADLDWDQIDLSEWIGLMEESGMLPSETNEEQLTGDGRLINNGSRDTVSERTMDRLGGEGTLDRQKQLNKDLKVDNIDCSLIPRPAVCSYASGEKLGAGTR